MADKEKTKTPLSDAAESFADGGRISFHVPGHKGNADETGDLGRIFGENVLARDLTELPGLDDLHNAGGVIREAEEKAAELFGADETFFLANGTTSGVAAAIAAVSSEKSTVVIERCTHGCTTSGLVISGASPYYIFDEYDRKTHLPAGISAVEVEKALKLCENPCAVVLTHPGYYGTYSDLMAIVGAAHRAGVPVIADEAHGAQMMFTGQQIPSAMEAGADISVQSTHKMLGSLTQSSMLHVQGDLVDRKKLKFFINMMTSTSPSYLLTSSLDAVRGFMETDGERRWHEIAEAVRRTAGKIGSIHGIKCCRRFSGSGGQSHDIEGSRLLVTAADMGISGRKLEKILAEEYRIDAEFSDLMYVVLLAGTGSRQSDFDALEEALQDISFNYSGGSAEQGKNTLSEQLDVYDRFYELRPSAELTPRRAVYAGYAVLGREKAAGRVSASDISVYPPGIPAVRAGEVLSRDIIEYISECAKLGFEFHGLAGYGVNGEAEFFCAEDERDSIMLGSYF